MRKIEPYFDKIPNSLAKAKEGREFPKDSKDVKSNIYSKAKFGDGQNGLFHIFKKKCAYCEINVDGGAHYHVEHYRPKGNKEKNYDGYYWLGYEWSNFLLVCPSCNTKKNDVFPLLKDKGRVKSPPKDVNGKILTLITDEVYKNENSLLLHPVIHSEEIDKHIYFLKTGKIMSQPKSKIGEKSIEIYDLNRSGLVLKRAKIGTEEILKSIINDYLSEKRLFDKDEIDKKLRGIVNKLKNEIKYGDVEFIGFRKAILKNFITFIIQNQVILKAKQGSTEKIIEIPQKDLWIQCLMEIRLQERLNV
jgi:uncharacterized protein (TIGR02646 family)